VREVCDLNKLASNPRANCAHLLMRAVEELLQNTEFMHEFECRWMDRVATKVPQKVGVLFQHHDVDARPRQQQSQHHSCRAAAGDTATRAHPLVPATSTERR
jgi:hypothetical protein